MRYRGFTLVELMLVVAILATLAGSVVMLADDTQLAVDEKIVLREALVLREAVTRFQADTGWYPGEGPFDLDESASGTARHPHAAVTLSTVQGKGVPNGQEARWFDNAANVWQLVESPLPASHPLASWDPDRSRGWHGPYLTLSTEGQTRTTFVSSRDASTSSFVVPLAPAIADPFLRECPASASAAGYWAALSGEPSPRQGQPLYLFLPRDTSGLVIRNSPDARVVSIGLDNTLGTADDTVVYLFR